METNFIQRASSKDFLDISHDIIPNMISALVIYLLWGFDSSTPCTSLFHIFLELMFILVLVYSFRGFVRIILIENNLYDNIICKAIFNLSDGFLYL